MNPLMDHGLYRMLIAIDEQLVDEVRAQDCPDCGAKLHDGGFERKPVACPARFREAFSWRTSLDCSRCRHRAMPPSVRFLGRRRYIAAVFALVSPRGQSSSWLAQAVDVPVRTLDRWRRWWRETFVSSRQWRALQGRLLPPIEPDALPRELLDRLRSRRSTYRLVRLLKLLCPLSTSSVQWEPAM